MAKNRHMTLVTIIARWLLAAFFIVAGANHLRDPGFYLPMMPPYLPWPYALVIISGVAEIAGGLGLLIPTTRRWAGWGLIVLLLAIFPANLHMALNHTQLPGLHLSPLVLWLRLPVQVVFIAWVLWVSFRRTHRPRTAVS